MRKVRIVLVSALAAVGLAVSATTANAATVGNQVYNKWSSTGNVYVSFSQGGSFYRLGPNGYSQDIGANVQCLYPTKRAVSQWGGVYNAYAVRCFVSNYNQLVLQVG